VLQTYEATINTTAGNGNAYLSAATGTATGFTVTATSTTGDTYSITRAANGTITRSCTNSGTSTACVNSTW